MTIPRKNSRTTTIDSVRYRWTVSRQEFDSATVLLTFLAHEEPSCDPDHRPARRSPQPKLLATFAEKLCDVVTPSVATALIREALKKGWDPKGAKDHVIGERAAIRLLCI